nr:hypothetical protein GCM10020092_039110 [Actinoplanes digitatis]
MVSSGPTSCRRYSTAAATVPSVAYPLKWSRPPIRSTSTTGSTYEASTSGKKTVRRLSVASRVRRVSAIAACPFASRRVRRSKASIVRAPAVVAASSSAITELAAPSRRYASRARRRYHRVTNQMPVNPSRLGRAERGLSTTTAHTISSIWRTAMSRSGSTSRRVVATASTSVVPRAVRSPVGTRSTTAAGRASDSRRKPSRTRAAVRSPKRKPTSSAYREKRVCATAQTSTARASRSTRPAPCPAVTASMIRPSSHGPPRAASAARALRSSISVTVRRSAASSRRAARATIR